MDDTTPPKKTLPRMLNITALRNRRALAATFSSKIGFIGQMQRVIIGAIAGVLFNFGCVQQPTAAPQSVDVEALAATLSCEKGQALRGTGG
jgi:hypothetical protein